MKVFAFLLGLFMSTSVFAGDLTRSLQGSYGSTDEEQCYILVKAMKGKKINFQIFTDRSVDLTDETIVTEKAFAAAIKKQSFQLELTSGNKVDRISGKLNKKNQLAEISITNLIKDQADAKRSASCKKVFKISNVIYNPN